MEEAGAVEGEGKWGCLGQRVLRGLQVTSERLQVTGDRLQGTAGRWRAPSRIRTSKVVRIAEAREVAVRRVPRFAQRLLRPGNSTVFVSLREPNFAQDENYIINN
jgi:hypothetical protein